MLRVPRAQPSFATLVCLLVAGIVSCPRPASQTPRAQSSLVDQFLTKLGASDWQTRAKAVRALGGFKTPKAMKALGRLLQTDPEVRVRVAAAEACGEMRHASLLPDLKAAVMDPEIRVQHAAVRALGDFKSRAAVETLVAVLTAKQTKLERAVVKALMRTPATLLQDRETIVPHLLKVLKSSDVKQSSLARRQLVAVGEAAVPYLLVAMLGRTHGASMGTDCKSKSCQTIVAMGKRAVPALVRVMKKGGMSIYQRGQRTHILGMAAQFALKALGAKAVGHLVALLDQDNELAESARDLLEEIGEPAVPGLIRTLKKGALLARAVAANLLAGSKRPTAVAALKGALKDPSAKVREVACTSLASIDSNAARAALMGVLNSADELRLAMVRGLASSNFKNSTALLLRGLADRKASVAAAAAAGLGNPLHKSAAPALIKAMRKTRGGRPLVVRIAAARALGGIGVAMTVPPLVKLLRRSKDHQLRRAALHSLALLKGDKAYKAIRRVVRSRDKKLRLQAIRSLVEFNTKASKALLKTLSRSRNKQVAAAAKYALRGGALGFKPTGVPPCDRYFRLFSCYLSKLPAAARKPTRVAFKKTVEAYHKMAAGPTQALYRSCRMAMDAWSKIVSKSPRFKSCFAP